MKSRPVHLVSSSAHFCNGALGAIAETLSAGEGSAVVAYAVLLLASDEASFITGVALPIDGGRSIR